MVLNKYSLPLTIYLSRSFQFLLLNTTTRIIITITAIVKPTQTPALKIFPIAWHELNNVATNKNKNGVVIFDIVLSLNYEYNTIVIPEFKQ